jgi:hypothetical protein
LILEFALSPHSPKYLRIKGNFFVRGGISALITVVSGAPPKELKQEL